VLVKAALKIVLTSFYLMVIMFSALSQVKYLSNEILSALNLDDKKEIANAEKIRLYGDKLMRDAELIEEEHGISLPGIKDYQPEKIRQMDDKMLDVVRRSARKKIQASNYYGNSNLIVASIYTKKLKELSIESLPADKEKINLLMEENASLMRTSRLIRREALRMNNELLVYPYLMDANDIEISAINKLKEAFLLIYKDVVVNDKKGVLNNGELSEIKNFKNPVDIYFKIQVAASKESLSVEELNKIYASKEIISNEYDKGWYKYSIRKNFKTYEDAFKYKESINIKGAFIIAFVEGKKVPVSEAVNLQNTKANSDKERGNDKTVYRLRIGISTSPANSESIRKMKSGGKPVVMVNHDGWYTYTIGDFNSKREANNFKRKKGLNNATVVAFKNGKPIKNN